MYNLYRYIYIRILIDNKLVHLKFPVLSLSPNIQGDFPVVVHIDRSQGVDEELRHGDELLDQRHLAGAQGVTQVLPGTHDGGIIAVHPGTAQGVLLDVVPAEIRM